MNLTTKTSRKKIARSRTIVWSKIGKGRGLGYRRGTGDGPGIWYARVRGTKAPYVVRAIGTADDEAEANGENVVTLDQVTSGTVLSYEQANRLALGWSPGASKAPTTVREVMDAYLKDTHGKSLGRTRAVVEAHILPALGDRLVSELTAAEIREWHRALADAPKRLRGGNRAEVDRNDEEAVRRRQSSANRVLTVLKAALNHDADDDAPTPWRKVKAFPSADAARVRYLVSDEIKSLLEACPPDLRLLVEGALHTGCRAGELFRMRAKDFEAGGISVPKSKGGKPRHVFLGADGLAFFEALVKGKARNALLFLRADGATWSGNYHHRPFVQAVTAAGLEDGVTFHALRHSYASLYLMNHGSLFALSRQLGHADTRMVELHYGHLASKWRAEDAEKHAPRWEEES